MKTEITVILYVTTCITSGCTSARPDLYLRPVARLQMYHEMPSVCFFPYKSMLLIIICRGVKRVLANIHILHRIIFLELIRGEITFLQQHQSSKTETLPVWFIFVSNENIITNTEHAKNIETNEIHSNTRTCMHVYVLFINKRVSVFKDTLVPLLHEGNIGPLVPHINILCTRLR
jgi:hypothetical protein